MMLQEMVRGCAVEAVATSVPALAPPVASR
jgi:hypothetical protein